jgi:hypothetical protein
MFIITRTFIFVLICISTFQLTTACRLPIPCSGCGQPPQPWEALTTLSLNQQELVKSFQAATSKVYNLANEISSKPKSNDPNTRVRIVSAVEENIAEYTTVLESTKLKVKELNLELDDIGKNVTSTMEKAGKVTDSINNERERQREDVKNQKVVRRWNKSVDQVETYMDSIDDLLAQGDVVKKKLELIILRDKVDVSIKAAEETSTEANQVIEDLEKLLDRIDKFIESHSDD